jgi:hypothetical protein
VGGGAAGAGCGLVSMAGGGAGGCGRRVGGPAARRAGWGRRSRGGNLERRGGAACGLGPTVGGGSGLRAATADGVGEQRRLAVALEENETARAGARPYNGNLRQPA